MLHKILRALLTLLTAATLAACSSSRSADTGGGYTTDDKTDNSSYAQQVDRLASTYGTWTNVSVPLKVDLRSPKDITISGRAYMVRGKSVLISLKFLGMEVATIYITGDSVYATEKIHKYYVAEDVRSLMGGYPLTINEVQDLLLGRAFIVGKGTLSVNNRGDIKAQPTSTPGSIKLVPKKTPGGIKYEFDVNTTDNRVAAINVQAGLHDPVRCDYSSPIKTPYGTLAGRASFNAKAGKQKIDAALVWNFKSADWNVKDLRRWSAPKGYKRLGTSELLNMLSSF